MPRIAVVGCGATGSRVARQLLRARDRDVELILIDADLDVAHALQRSLGVEVPFGSELAGDTSFDVVVLAVRGGEHVGLAREALELGSDAVSTSDSLDDVAGLLGLDEEARAIGAQVVVGAGMMPGLSDVLARHGASWFDDVREIHVSKFGTGGPDCARQHHQALKGRCLDWRHAWHKRPGGSGRELAWFPAPVQAADCYRARLGDPLLLLRAHPDVERITARMAATRRDRLTMHLPMLRRPHPEGLLGAVRVELRGLRDGAQHELVLGCAERPAVAAAVVASTAALELLDTPGVDGAHGVAETVEAVSFLRRLQAGGLRPQVFEGSTQTV